MSGREDIHILILERDVYARHAIASYLSWDRNTRVIEHVGSSSKLFRALGNLALVGAVDAVIIDTMAAPTPDEMTALIRSILDYVPDAAVICLSHFPDLNMIAAAYDAGARAYFTREQVGIGIAHAVRYVLARPFTVTRDVLPMLSDKITHNTLQAEVLPCRRQYPRLTARIEQAIQLCVVEGLPAELAAEEMGVSVSTVRSYIKEGYRILEAADDHTYPTSMLPVERAFHRYSALDMPTDELEGPREQWLPAA